MLGADIGGELVSNSVTSSEDVAALFDDIVDRGLQPVADTFALRAKIDDCMSAFKNGSGARGTTTRTETTT